MLVLLHHFQIVPRSPVSSEAARREIPLLAAFGPKTARPIVTLLTHRHHRLAGRLAQRLQPNWTSSLEGVADAHLLTGLYGR